MQSLAERAQGRANLLTEGTKLHAELSTTREAVLQAKIEARKEVQHLKDEATLKDKAIEALKQELEAAKLKAKEAEDDLKVVATGTS